LLRNTLIKAHIGLIDGTAPGSGGTDDLMGFIRGSLVGDVVGYSSANRNGYPVVRYFPPSSPMTTDAQGGTSLTNLFSALMNGSKNVSYITIPFPPGGDVTNETSLSSLENLTQGQCFPGFYFYYNAYLQDVEHYYFGTPLPSSTGSICNIPYPSLSESEAGNFITNSTLPVLLILKLAYVNQDPSLVNTAAEAMAAGYTRSLFGDILQSVEINVMAAKNVYHQNKQKIWDLYVSKIQIVRKAINGGYDRKLALLNKQITTVDYYKKLNKDWTNSLSQYGLQGAYNFNP
jgi:hypothetical protein